MTPGATYRVQLNPDFGFEEVGGIAPYLGELGVTHVYCSPYLQAVPGSAHGYDVTDPTHVSRQLGGAPGHAAMGDALRAAGLGQILDIVPNHMAADPSNPWWWDVLEKGPASEWADHFDIDWTRQDESSQPKVLVPILGDHYRRVLESGELCIERSGDRFQLVYHEHRLPVSLPTMRNLLAAAIDEELKALNSNPDRLDEVLSSQFYRLAYWRVANEEVDYRRFFNIESLVGVRVEDPEVFAGTHRLILDLVREGTVSGLRVDHIDGLRQPRQYLHGLAGASAGTYLVVEKILEPGESLPESWPVAGTTGYDFLDRVNQLFVDSTHEEDFDRIYTSFTGEPVDYPELVLRAKREIMANQLAAEMRRLTGTLAGIFSDQGRHRDHTRRDLEQALTELIAGYEVYRTYVEPGGVAGEADRAMVARAVTKAAERHPDPELIAFLGRLATGDQRDTHAEREFTQRLQQVTAPVMAKSVEDTAFYRFNRLVSLNEVGGDPGTFGRPVQTFHERTAATARAWPDTMLTLTTHDTKRSADVRARLNVLSELPGPWRQAVQGWATRNEPRRTGTWPDANTEYLLYQTLVGAWPIDSDRVVEYMVKATREARVHTSWVEPNEGFEKATTGFARRILDDPGFTAAIRSFLAEHRVVERGRRNSLAQVALAMTAPGVPDIYQGDELWNLSLVDPDNRRPVDFRQRREALESLATGTTALADDDIGITKLRLLHALLRHRNENRDRAASASYEPIEVKGPAANEIVAYRRANTITLVAVRSRPNLSGTIDLPRSGVTEVVTHTYHAGGSHPIDEVLAGSPLAVLEEGRS